MARPDGNTPDRIVYTRNGTRYTLSELPEHVAIIIGQCETKAAEANRHAQQAEYHRQQQLRAEGAAKALSDAADALMDADEINESDAQGGLEPTPEADAHG